MTETYAERSTRSVAEIMGWHAEVHPTTTPLFLCWHKPNGDITKDEPTVDDMIAWLRERDWVAECRVDVVNDRITASAWQPGRTEISHASTLLAALEAVVRTVADESCAPQVHGA